MTIAMTDEEVREMLKTEARVHGITVDRLATLGEEDKLFNPALRDLWLIWQDDIASLAQR